MKTGIRKRLNIQSIKCGSELQLNLSFKDTSLSKKNCLKRPIFPVKKRCFQYKLYDKATSAVQMNGA